MGQHQKTLPEVFHDGLKKPKNKPVIIEFKRFNFQKRYFPGSTRRDWKNWHWQLQNSINDLDRLDLILGIDKEKKETLQNMQIKLPLRITPYYSELLSGLGREHPLRLTVIPDPAEFSRNFGEDPDPLHEENDKQVPGLVHRYPDRVLILLTDFCSVNCRYCTRTRMVGQNRDVCDFDLIIQYLQQHQEVRDVLLSGGDPLTLDDCRLQYYLDRLKSIKHIEMIRIGTKVPVVLPQRINSGLVNLLKKYQPLYMSIHFTHPDELTEQVINACNLLANAGIPLGSQTVLLKGVNDSAAVLKRLFQRLLQVRVKPYYLYQCDPISGSAHFRTDVERGIEIIEKLRGHTSGYAVPVLVIDAPGGGGKIPIQPNYIVDQNKDYVFLRNYEHKIFAYPKLK